MAVSFALKDKETGELAILQDVDNEMREALGIEPDAKDWYKNWHGTIGFGIACGQSELELWRNWGRFKGDCMDFLVENYEFIRI